MRHVGSVFLWSWIVLWGGILAVAGLVLMVPLNPWVDPRRRIFDLMGKLWGKGVLLALPFIDVELVGAEHLRGGPYLICPNHTSIADTVVLLAKLPPFKFIARKLVFSVPPLSLHAWLSGYVLASSGEAGGAERVQRETSRWLARGNHVLVFPEGTRSPDGKVLRFRKGPIGLAQAAGVKILPVAVSGNHYIIPKGSFSYRFRGKVRVEVLAPMDSSGDPKEVAAVVREKIQAALRPELLWQEAGPRPATATPTKAP